MKMRASPESLRPAFIEAMSRAACSVNVVTTEGPEGRAGVTVTAMSSVSADGPAPRLLICLHRDGGTCSQILRNGIFCVNLLREDQQRIAEVFAGRVTSGAGRRESAATWIRMAHGAPRLADPLAAFGCRIVEAQLVGSHYVIFGAVEDVHITGQKAALIYANRRYGRAETRRVTGQADEYRYPTCSLNSRITWA